MDSMIGPYGALGYLMIEVFGPSSKIVGEGLAERLAILNEERLAAFRSKFDRKLKERGLGAERKKPSFGPTIDILKLGAREEEEELQELWAGLLVAAVDPSAQSHRSFAQIVSGLEPIDVRVLTTAFLAVEASPRYERNHSAKQTIAVSSGRLADHLSIDREEIHLPLDNLSRVQCISPAVAYQTGGKQKHPDMRRPFAITRLGFGLMTAVRPDPSLDGASLPIFLFPRYRNALELAGLLLPKRL